MNIAIGSAFRNSRNRLGTYFDRVQRFKATRPGDHVRVIAVEGDSVDGTREAIIKEANRRDIGVELRPCDHGGPVFGSVETFERFKALSRVGNQIFEGVKLDDDVLVYVESDLLWEPAAINELIEMIWTRANRFSVVAPLVMAGDLFYDIWGYRGLDGRRFSPFAPHYPGLFDEEIFMVGSVGSCLVMHAETARTSRIKNDLCLVGWCEDARSKGWNIGVAPRVIVRHPA